MSSQKLWYEIKHLEQTKFVFYHASILCTAIFWPNKSICQISTLRIFVQAKLLHQLTNENPKIWVKLHVLNLEPRRICCVYVSKKQVMLGKVYSDGYFPDEIYCTIKGDYMMELIPETKVKSKYHEKISISNRFKQIIIGEFCASKILVSTFEA